VCLRQRDSCRGGRPCLFQTRGCCYWWEINPSGNLSFVKRILVGRLSGVWTQKYCDCFGWWPLRLRGEITSAEGVYDWGRRAVPLLNYTLAFPLQLRKSTENLNQGSRVVGDYALRWLGWLYGQPRLACWASVHLGYPYVTSASPLSAQVPSKLPN
jgi:hypothetical protein